MQQPEPVIRGHSRAGLPGTPASVRRRFGQGFVRQPLAEGVAVCKSWGPHLVLTQPPDELGYGVAADQVSSPRSPASVSHDDDLAS
jgi:hypothetical protein